MELLELDGSLGEGGGQILRTSLALSIVTGQGFHLRHVRAGRAKPGLQPQHLMSVRAAATICGGQTRGASRGSSDLVFEPGPVRPGSYRFDIGTAGATSLVLHTIYLPLALKAAGPSTITLIGGTHVRASPSFHFLDATWRRLVGLCGLHVRLKLVRPGFYPRGGGTVEAVVQPVERLSSVNFSTRGPLAAAGFSAIAGLPMAIARRQARRATFRLQQQGLPVTLREEEWQGGPGTVVALELSGGPVPVLFVAIGERGKPAERVADDAADDAIAFVKANPAPIDAHSADQLVLPLVLAVGSSEFRVAEITRHLTTNVAVIRRFLDRKIEVEGAEGMSGIVRVT